VLFDYEPTKEEKYERLPRPTIKNGAGVMAGEILAGGPSKIQTTKKGGASCDMP
jgi:hypothetical protein